MEDSDYDILIEYMHEKRDYFLLMLKQIQLEKLEDMTPEEQMKLKQFEKEIEDSLNYSNQQISKFILENNS